MNVEKLNEKLFKAYKKRDIEKIKSLLKQGADVNATDKYGDTLLGKAAAGGYKYVCEFLITNGADVNKANDDGRTALMRAAGSGYINVCELLVKNGADVNATDRKGNNALMHAMNGQPGMMFAANVNMMDLIILLRLLYPNKARTANTQNDDTPPENE